MIYFFKLGIIQAQEEVTAFIRRIAACCEDGAKRNGRRLRRLCPRDQRCGVVAVRQSEYPETGDPYACRFEVPGKISTQLDRLAGADSDTGAAVKMGRPRKLSPNRRIRGHSRIGLKVVLQGELHDSRVAERRDPAERRQSADAGAGVVRLYVV